MEVKQLTLGAMASNCYIVRDNDQVLIIDPGDLPEVIISNINKNDKVLAVLLTHGHFDHIGALNRIVEKYNCPVYASTKEAALINDPNLSFYNEKIVAEITYIDKSFSISDFRIILHKTPGHTSGSVMYQIDNHLFTGDTIFDRSIGRTDFPTGSSLEMLKSLDYIKTLDPQLIIYPGHNSITTLQKQLKINPYLNRWR